MSNRSIALLTAAVALTSTAVAHAQPCEDGMLGPAREWEGMMSYGMRMASGPGGTMVLWTARPVGTFDAQQVHTARMAPGGGEPIRGGLEDAINELGLVALNGGGAVYLQETVVWTGNDQASRRLAVRRLGPDGAVLGAVALGPYPVTGSPRMAVNFDGQRYLTTWVGEDADGKRALRLSRLDAQGTLLDATAIAVASNDGFIGFNQAVRVGDVTWVVWDHGDYNSDATGALGVRVADDGTVIDRAPVVLVADGRPVALASRGDTAVLVTMGAAGRRAVTLGAQGVRPGAPTAVPLTDEDVLIDLMPSVAGDGFTMWIMRFVPAPLPSLSVARLSAHAVTRGGVVSPRPFIVTEGHAITRDGTDYLVAGVVEDATGVELGAVGHQRARVSRFRADGTPAGDVVLHENTVTFVEHIVCFTNPDEHGCSAGGGAGGAALVLVAIGLIALPRRRRQRRRGAGPGASHGSRRRLSQ